MNDQVDPYTDEILYCVDQIVPTCNKNLWGLTTPVFIDTCDPTTPTSSNLVSIINIDHTDMFTLIWSAIDDNGNQGTCDQIVTVFDTTPPALICADQTVYTCDYTTVMASLIPPTPIDDCPNVGSPSVLNPFSYSFTDDVTTDVVWIV